MTTTRRPLSPDRLALLQWTARLGAVTAEALALCQDCSVSSARARLQFAARAGLLSQQRPLVGHGALFSITRTGLRACGLHGLDPCRVSAGNARHAIACCHVAAALELGYPDHRVVGEPELRRLERERGAPLASAWVGGARPHSHRPDLVLAPRGGAPGLPVAVEVELTVKAPRRLEAICRAWARCRRVAGVLYLAAAEVEPALTRAIDKADADERVVVVPLVALPGATPE